MSYVGTYATHTLCGITLPDWVATFVYDKIRLTTCIMCLTVLHTCNSITYCCHIYTLSQINNNNLNKCLIVVHVHVVLRNG